jgi:N-acetylglutamate synthase-like GNAT family acetyltransferase
MFWDTDIHRKLDAILELLRDIKKKEIIMSKELDALEVAVTENTALDTSIIALVEGLAAQIESMKDDPAKMEALAASLREKSAALAAAIQANTPPTP